MILFVFDEMRRDVQLSFRFFSLPLVWIPNGLPFSSVQNRFIFAWIFRVYPFSMAHLMCAQSRLFSLKLLIMQ